MNIRVDVRVAAPREAVFAVFRDRLAKLVERSSNARIVEVRERAAQGALLRVISEWRGGGELPAAARGIVTAPMLVWTDEAIWDGNALFCDWRLIASGLLPDALQCSGRTSFLPGEDGGTRVQFVGRVATNGRKLPGVPSFLAPIVSRSVDEFLVAKIQSNFLETAAAAEDRLAPAR